MFRGLRRRFGRDASADDEDLRAERHADRVPGDSQRLDAPAAGYPGEVEFAAYAEDCRIFGFLHLAADRMSDALNAAREYALSDVLLIGLDGQRGAEMRQLTVQRDELLAVRAAGPRGDPARRARVRPSPVTVKTGPLTIHGYVHGPPGADPVRALERRKPMVPLTDAWIEYQSNGQLHRARVGTIIVNRELLDWVRPSKDAEVRLPEMPAEITIDPRAKDMTGYIFAGGRPTADEP